MLRLNISLVIYVIYITQICSSNFDTYCMGTEVLPHNGLCEIVQSMSSLTITEEKDERGVYELLLVTSIPECASVNHLTVDLSITNATGENACNYDRNALHHSYTEYEFESTTSCTKRNFTVEMDSIYTGCYIMSFSLYEEYESKWIPFQPLVFTKWISNNYTVEDFRVKLKGSSEDSSDDTKVFVRFEPAKINKWNYSLRLYYNETESPENVKVLLSGYIFLMDAEDNCTVTEGEMACVFHKLPIGHYKLQFKLEDVPWCIYMDGVFGNDCNWNVDFEAKRVNSNVEKALEFKSWPQVEAVHSALIGLLCLVVLVLCVLVYVSRQYRYSRKKMIVSQWRSLLANVSPDGKTRLEAECKDRASGILLLYARDCRPFMQLMEHFRELLQAETGLEVYDLFDYRRFNEISSSPAEWIQGLLQDTHIKTVLVGTQCGDLMYRNLMQRFEQADEDDNNSVQMCTLYRNPEFLDGVVLHAIKMVSFDVDYQRPYQKYFVSYIPNFSSDNTLYQINPFKRYALPGAAMRLVADLRHSPDTPLVTPTPHSPLATPTPDTPLTALTPSTLHQLRESVIQLSEYVASRPHYLHTELLKEG